MERRQFSLILLVGCSLLGLTRFAWSSNPTTRSISIVANLFTHHDSAIHLGQHYLTLFPQEANYDWLVNQTLPHEYAHIQSQSLKQTLRMQRGKDFYEGNTVIIDGWVLSRTEARLCALLALA